MRDEEAPNSATHPRTSTDKDAQDLVIESLRGQIQDLFSQVSLLNSKLVKSYDRVSDLEDDLHVASANFRTSSLKISQLELERTQHLSALNTGLLVEKSHVTAELNRLMEKATEEAAQRGQAESARIAIEKDLDDLSASLFGQANTMVAEARYERHLSERKVEDAERALKSAEEAVQVMQSHMQALEAEKEAAENKTRDMEMAMGKGKWVKRRDSDTAVSLRLLNTHAPYHEFLAFVAHLRVLHPTSLTTPAMSTLLQLPFLARLLTEDSEPTVRLDLAPSLNWLSRRSVLAAIHSGQLMIEPMSALSLFAESSTLPTATTIAGINSSNDNISCALCGTSIFPTPDHSSRAAAHPLSQSNTSWSEAFFKKTSSIGYSNSNTNSPTRSSHRASIASIGGLQIFIFRLASPPSTTIASLPLPSLAKSSVPFTSSSTSSLIASSSSHSGAGNAFLNSPSPNHHHNNYSSSNNNTSQPTTIYPLCTSGWCLNRLRLTCTLWAFVRTGIVEKVWEEELPPPPPPPSHPPAAITVEKNGQGDRPPIPPRKRGLWGGIASAIGERAASWSESDREKTKKAEVQQPPPAPAAAAHPPAPAQEQRRLPPPLAAPSAARSASASNPASQPNPPPLPKRNDDRSGVRGPHSPPPPPPPSKNTESESRRTSADLQPVQRALSPIRGAHLQVQAPSQTTPVAGGGAQTQAPTPAAPTLPPRSTHTRTPSTVPLPDSRPGTPGVPSRVASPAGGVAGGAPPPIPRRAAARARGPPPPGGAGGSRPATPSAIPVPVSAGSVDEAAGVGKVEKAAEEGKTSSEVAGEGNKENKDKGGEMSPGSDVFVDALATSPGQDVGVASHKDDEEKVAGGGGDSEVAASPQKAAAGVAGGENLEAPSSADGEFVHVDGVDDEKEKEKANATENEEKESAEAESERLELDRKKREKDEKEEKEKERAAGFVGVGTWEERTWKELVRLREDMFWARVGGFRE